MILLMVVIGKCKLFILILVPYAQNEILLIIQLANIFLNFACFISICWFVGGRIKAKISTLYAIKYQCAVKQIQYSYLDYGLLI